MSTKKILPAPTKPMTAGVARAEPHISTMARFAQEHGNLILPDLCMHVDVDPKGAALTPRPDRVIADGVMVAPCAFSIFRRMKIATSTEMVVLLSMENDVPGDLVLMVTDGDAVFYGWAVKDFGISPLAVIGALPGTQSVQLPEPPPDHIRKAAADAAAALVGHGLKDALMILHGEQASPKMTKARQLAGSDWPMVEDHVSCIFMDVPVVMVQLLSELSPATRRSVWYLDAHDGRAAGAAFVVQDPDGLEQECLDAGMVLVKWDATNCPNRTLRKRLKPGSKTFVWYEPSSSN